MCETREDQNPQDPPVSATASLHQEEAAELLSLLERAQGGDREAFGELYSRCHGRVYALTLRMSGNSTRAEDLTQEVFLRLWRKMDRFQGRSAFTTWLHRMTVHLLIDHMRSESRKAGREVFDDGWERIPEPVRTRPGIGVDLEQAIRSLPPGARTVLVLHDLEGYRHEDIANMVGIAVGTSKAQLHRARKLLREKLS